jgi:hypothetical protein
MFLFYPIFLFIALLYTMVGLGGGSAYVAFLSIAKIPHVFIPSTALFLNIVATLIGSFNYRIHINFKERKNFLIPLYTISIIGVLLGSSISLRKREFFIVLGLCLVIASLISLFRGKVGSNEPEIKGEIVSRTILLVLFSAFLFGFLAGLVGIGGGVFLSPILLLAGFPVKETAAITSLYIFLNSSSGFLSHLMRGNVNFSLILPFSIFVLIGAVMGSTLGSFKLKPSVVKKVLSFIIFVIGIRILWITIS